MALLRLKGEANCLTLQPTKQSPKHQLSSNPNRSYPYRASGLVRGSTPEDWCVGQLAAHNLTFQCLICLLQRRLSTRTARLAWAHLGVGKVGPRVYFAEGWITWSTRAILTHFLQFLRVTCRRALRLTGRRASRGRPRRLRRRKASQRRSARSGKLPYGDDTPNVQVGRRINMKGSVCVGSAIVLVIAANLAPTALVADQPAPLQCSAGTTFNAQTHKCVSSLKPPNVAPAATAPTSTKPFPITSIPHPAAVESPAKTKSQECSALATGFGGTVPTNSVANAEHSCDLVLAGDSTAAG